MTMKRPDGSELHIGDRIECDEHRGTLKFIGEIENMSGIWLGVDWDDVARGKHDGSYKDRKYFETKYPTSGSFITPKKAKLGISFYEAYQMKMSELNESHNRMKMFVLENRAIYGIGPPETIVPLSDTFSRVVDLDLSGNLLKSWEDVSEITILIPTLTSLNVSHNRLSIPAVKDPFTNLFANIQELVMNHMGYNWSDILNSTSMFPNLRSLFVCYNDLNELVDSSNYLQKLERLSIAYNHITEWKDVLKLGQLPELKILYTNHNGFLSTYFNDVTLEEEQKTKYFPKLETLELNNNQIQHLSAIDELSKLPSLRNFSITNNPLEHEFKENLYLIIIGKLGGLETYTKAKISSTDRKNAEIYYLHMIAKQALAHQWSEEIMVKQHSRYKELIQKYGLPNPNALQQPSTNLKDKLIPVNFKSPNAPDKVFKQKKLSPTMTVLKLKSFVQRLYKITDTMNLKLSYVSKRCPELEVDFDEDLTELRYYSIENGDTIIVKW